MIGANAITVIATDAVGNQTTRTVNVTRTSGASPPAIAIDSPGNGATLRSPVVVTGAVSGGTAPVTVEVNGTAASMSFETFTATLASADGGLTITATARDAVSLTAHASVNVIVDSTPPALVITSPADGVRLRHDGGRSPGVSRTLRRSP